MNKKNKGMKVMHLLSKDTNGDSTVTSPKLKEAVTPASKADTLKTASKPPAKKSNGDEQLSILKALHSLGGKDIDSPSIGKKVGLDKKFPKSFRGHVRDAMEHFEKQGFVKRKREGLKYSFTITAAGEKHLENPKSEKDSDKSKAHPAPASAASASSIQVTRPPNTDIECPKCRAFNPFQAEYCKSCGTVLRDRAKTVFEAAPVAA